MNYNQYKIKQKKEQLKRELHETDDFCHIRINGEDCYAETRHPLVHSLIVALKISDEIDNSSNVYADREKEASKVMKLLNEYYS